MRVSELVLSFFWERLRGRLINLWFCCGPFLAARVAFMAEYAIISFCRVINDAIVGRAPGFER